MTTATLRWGSLRWLACVALTIGMAIGAPCRGAEPVAPAQQVKVGLFITGLGDFDLPRRTFNVTFWAWFLHRDPAYKPAENIEVVNAKQAPTKFASSQRMEDVAFDGGRSAVSWSQAKYIAAMSQDWDVANYPFDRQRLHIHLEDAQSDVTQVVLQPDTLTPSKIDESVTVPGWTIESMTLRGSDHVYQSDFGDPTLEGTSTFSRITAEIVVKRDGWRLLSNMFIGFFVAFALASASYLLDAAGAIANARVGLSGGAIFASVGNKYVIDNNVPPASVFTLADGIESSTFAAILFAIIASVVVMSLKPRRPATAARVNAICGLGSMIGYLAFNATLILRAAP